MGNFVKKNWFICLLAVLLAGVSCFYIYDTNKGKLKGKTANGEGVVYEVNNTDVTASEFYDDLYKNGGISTIYYLFERTVVNQAVETDDTMTETAKSNAEYIISNYKSYYPTNYEEVLGQALKQVGYSSVDDLQTYLIQYQKLLKISAEYAKSHSDELQVRNVSYILIKFEDSSNPSAEGAPTDDEKARMKAVDDALSSGSSFEEAAKSYSEDSSASSGGVLGTIDANTSSVDVSFLNAALSLGEGQVSDWIYSSSFGYFKIMNNASTVESLEALANTSSDNSSESTAEASASASTTSNTDPYEELVSSYDTTLNAKALWDKAKELGIDFGDNADLKASLLNYMGISDTEE